MGQPQEMAGARQDPGTESWTYGGIRADKNGKRWHAWLDQAGKEHWFSGTGSQMAVGSRYTVQVSRHDGTLTLHGTPEYAGTEADQDTRRALWAEHTVAQAKIEALRAERNAARRNALDEGARAAAGTGRPAAHRSPARRAGRLRPAQAP